MSVWEGVLVLVAGIWAGAINTVVGSGTLVTFPVLLAVGLPPVTANVSNTVGLFPGSFVGAYGYRRELAGQRRRVIVLASASVLGAIAGAVLLLELPPGAFKAIVPVLIVLALLLVVFGKPLTGWLTARGHAATEHVTVALWLVDARHRRLRRLLRRGAGRAADGLPRPVPRRVAATAERAEERAGRARSTSSPPSCSSRRRTSTGPRPGWSPAGSVLGGLLGARIGRRLPPAVLRAVIVVVGVAAIVKLVL